MIWLEQRSNAWTIKWFAISNQQLLIKNRRGTGIPIGCRRHDRRFIFFEKWVDGFDHQKWIELPEGDYTEIKIDPGHIMPEISG
jgi:hypothetical protein